MEKFIVNRWMSNKDSLKDVIKKNKIKDTCDSYSMMTDVLIREVLNKPIDDNDFSQNGVFSENYKIVDDGDYQGTQLFILHKAHYQPSVEDYYVFDNSYGSCSGCDTLLSITSYDSESFPSDYQINELMTLFLHMIQRLKCLNNLYI